MTAGKISRPQLSKLFALMRSKIQYEIISTVRVARRSLVPGNENGNRVPVFIRVPVLRAAIDRYIESWNRAVNWQYSFRFRTPPASDFTFPPISFKFHAINSTIVTV
jgi:hypothetical protein